MQHRTCGGGVRAASAVALFGAPCQRRALRQALTNEASVRLRRRAAARRTRRRTMSVVRCVDGSFARPTWGDAQALRPNRAHETGIWTKTNTTNDVLDGAAEDCEPKSWRRRQGTGSSSKAASSAPVAAACNCPFAPAHVRGRCRVRPDRWSPVACASGRSPASELGAPPADRRSAEAPPGRTPKDERGVRTPGPSRRGPRGSRPQAVAALRTMTRMTPSLWARLGGGDGTLKEKGRANRVRREGRPEFGRNRPPATRTGTV